MVGFDEHGLYCDQCHNRINFDSWAEAEDHELTVHLEHWRNVRVPMDDRKTKLVGKGYVVQTDEGWIVKLEIPFGYDEEAREVAIRVLRRYESM